MPSRRTSRHAYATPAQAVAAGHAFVEALGVGAADMDGEVLPPLEYMFVATVQNIRVMATGEGANGLLQVGSAPRAAALATPPCP